jgi:hypothetical protein
MKPLTARPLRLWIVEFEELYARHLCRHSQLGVNVAHLLALFGTWYAFYGLLFWITGSAWALAAPALVYLGALAPNLPARLLAACAVFLGLVLAAVLLLPSPPFWVYLAMIPVFYKLQAWSHRLWDVERDMSEFNKKYRKGLVLFVVLLLYEVPIVLHYLLFAADEASAATDLADQETAPARAG